jgi:K+-sensing histidine kinase KdpD
MNDESSRLVAGLGAVAAIVVSAVLVPARDFLGSTNVALILAIVVVVAAVFGGRLAGVLTSVAAAVGFDYFQTEPYLSLRIDKREDVIAAILLLILGIIVGELAVLRYQSRREAVVQAEGAVLLEDVAAVVAAGAAVDEVWPLVRRGLSHQLGLAGCRFEPQPFHEAKVAIGRTGGIESDELHYEQGGFALPSDGAAIPVVHAGRLLGRLVLLPNPKIGTSRAQRRVAVALADQLAVAAAHSQPLSPLS